MNFSKALINYERQYNRIFYHLNSNNVNYYPTVLHYYYNTGKYFYKNCTIRTVDHKIYKFFNIDINLSIVL